MSINKQALWLSYFTAGYNILEGIIAVSAGISVASIALTGFGLDSFIESLSGGILVWRFVKSKEISHTHEDKIEQKAIRLIAYTFFILGTYVLYESIKKLYYKEIPGQSLIGIIIAIISIIIMSFLYTKKKNLGMENHVRSLVADSKQTLACIYMSITMLIGLGLNYIFSFWWADPTSGIIIAGFLFKEGYNTYKEKKLCNC